MAAKSTDQEAPPDLQQLKYKTWALKVSIHCEGCKRKVKKVLQGIEGVYKTDIDSQQHKVIVTGNVESDTLLKQLGRYGKHAELWPENPETKTKKKKKKKKNKSNNGNGSQNQPGQEPSEDDDENENDHPPPQVGKDDVDSDEDDDEGEEAAGGDGTAPPATTTGKKKKKKKKKKVQNGENPPNPDSVGHGPSEPQQFYSYGQGVPMFYHQPPALPPSAAYGLSYSTMNPRGSESYYARDPMHDHHYASGYNNNYRYVRAGNGDEVYNLYDDDEGGCSVM